MSFRCYLGTHVSFKTIRNQKYVVDKEFEKNEIPSKYAKAKIS